MIGYIIAKINKGPILRYSDHLEVEPYDFYSIGKGNVDEQKISQRGLVWFFSQKKLNFYKKAPIPNDDEAIFEVECDDKVECDDLKCKTYSFTAKKIVAVGEKGRDHTSLLRSFFE